MRGTPEQRADNKMPWGGECASFPRRGGRFAHKKQQQLDGWLRGEQRSVETAKQKQIGATIVVATHCQNDLLE
uniref:Uncharacterized protein n=1 Tax=Globodera rostochiensis TaxID=31243 RepID=A0A914I103_GLORO